MSTFSAGSWIKISSEIAGKKDFDSGQGTTHINSLRPSSEKCADFTISKCKHNSQGGKCEHLISSKRGFRHCVPIYAKAVDWTKNKERGSLVDSIGTVTLTITFPISDSSITV